MFRGLLFFLLFLINQVAAAATDPSTSCSKPRPNNPRVVLKILDPRGRWKRLKGGSKNFNGTDDHRIQSNATAAQKEKIWSEFVKMMQYSNYCLVGSFTKMDDLRETRANMRKALKEQGTTRCPLAEPLCSFFHNKTKNGTHVIMQCNDMNSDTLKQLQDTADGKEVLLDTGYRGVMCMNIYCQLEEAARHNMSSLFHAFLHYYLNDIEEKDRRRKADQQLKEQGVLKRGQAADDEGGDQPPQPEPGFLSGQLRFAIGTLILLTILGAVFFAMGYLPKWRRRLRKKRGKLEKKEKRQARMAHHSVFGEYQEKTEAQKRMTQL